MRFESIALVLLGCLVNGFTFVVGLAVGISLFEGKQNGNSNENEEDPQGIDWHKPLDIGAPHCPELRSGCRANPKPKTDPSKRQDRR
jgi:hypothetical protein